jgi:hypothetical protein
VRYRRGLFLAWLLLWVAAGIGCAAPAPAPQPSPDTSPGEAVLPPDILKDIRVVDRDVHLMFALSGSTWRTYTVYDASDPFRVIVALPNTAIENVPTPLLVGNEMIDRIETAMVAYQPQPHAWVVIELKRETTYHVERVGAEIVASFDPAPGAQDASPSGAKSPSAPTVEEKPRPRSYGAQDTSLPPAPEEPAAVPSGPPPARTLLPAQELLALEQLPTSEGIEFRLVGDGSFAAYNAFHLTDPPRVVVDLIGVQGSQVKGGVRARGSLVNKVRVGFHAGKVRVVFDLIPARGVPYWAAAEGDELIVTFKPGAGFPSQSGRR